MRKSSHKIDSINASQRCLFGLREYLNLSSLKEKIFNLREFNLMELIYSWNIK